MRRLIDEARRMGVTWEFTDDLDPHHPGKYADEVRHIWVLDGMTYTKTLCTFAHELGHAALGHSHSMFGHIEARQERAADEWAAHFLIDPDEYRIAEAKYGTRMDWIGQELGVLQRIAEAYAGSLLRLGDMIYVGSRMGDGQWAARITA